MGIDTTKSQKQGELSRAEENGLRIINEKLALLESHGVDLSERKKFELGALTLLLISSDGWFPTRFSRIRQQLREQVSQRPEFARMAGETERETAIDAATDKSLTEVYSDLMKKRELAAGEPYKNRTAAFMKMYAMKKAELSRKPFVQGILDSHKGVLLGEGMLRRGVPAAVDTSKGVPRASAVQDPKDGEVGVQVGNGGVAWPSMLGGKIVRKET